MVTYIIILFLLPQCIVMGLFDIEITSPFCLLLIHVYRVGKTGGGCGFGCLPGGCSDSWNPNPNPHPRVAGVYPPTRWPVNWGDFFFFLPRDRLLLALYATWQTPIGPFSTPSPPVILTISSDFSSFFQNHRFLLLPRNHRFSREIRLGFSGLWDLPNFLTRFWPSRSDFLFLFSSVWNPWFGFSSISAN